MSNNQRILKILICLCFAVYENLNEESDDPPFGLVYAV